MLAKSFIDTIEEIYIDTVTQNGNETYKISFYIKGEKAEQVLLRNKFYDMETAKAILEKIKAASEITN
jgi:hypothetical protein